MLSGGGVTKQDALNHIQGDQLLIGVNEDLEVIGFSAVNIETEERHGLDHSSIAYPCAYFAASAIAKPYQGMGLYARLNDQRLDFVEENKTGRLYTRTQNPRVEQGITQSLERLMKSGRIGSFIVSRHVLIGVYGGMLTDTKPQSRFISYDNLNYERGDANIVNWQLHP